MRPAGEVRAALLTACVELSANSGQGATLRELAQRACVGLESARKTIDNMARAGQLCIAGQRHVAYRNRPVAEYKVKDSCVV